MRFLNWIKNRMSIKLLFINLIGIIVATVLLTVFSNYMIQSSFRSRYEDKLRTPGIVFLSQFTHDDISPYINKLKARPDLYAESEQYFQDRQYVLSNRNPSAEYDKAKAHMEAYIAELATLKDENYRLVKQQMLSLHNGAGLTDFYIFADFGMPDMYIKIYDAVYQGGATGSRDEDFGVPVHKSMYKGAEEAFRTGETVYVLKNAGTGRNKSNYYSLTPVMDYYSDVIAVICAEIDMQSLDAQLQSFRWTGIAIIVSGALAYIAITQFVFRKLIVKPTQELVVAKDKALQANKAKSEFLSRVSHELRTPLNVINSMAKLGLKDTHIEESAERFNKIVASSGHLSNIINDVLEMSRMESGKTEIKNSPMRLRQAVLECAEFLSVRAKENNVELLTAVDPSIPEHLIGDEFRIRQVLINLLSNAVKFTAEGRVSLDVSVVEQSGDTCKVMFSVIDTGVGMSEDFLKKIFMPFEQEESFLSRKYEGSGLGLSISYNLVALMGGNMAVESKLGEGSRFAFTLPLGIVKDTETAEKAAQEKGVEVSLSGKRILLVDDIEINRAIILELFADTGAAFEEACDGEEAVQKFAASPASYYDCVFMDVQMPKMDGYSATAAIRASGRPDSGVPVIAMTANALAEDIERAKQAGMSDHIAKPIDFDDCLVKAKKWCGIK